MSETCECLTNYFEKNLKYGNKQIGLGYIWFTKIKLNAFDQIERPWPRVILILLGIQAFEKTYII